MKPNHLMLPTFEEIGKYLQKSSIDLHPSELHGVVCGFICDVVNTMDEETLWKYIFSSLTNNNTLRKLFQRMYASTFLQLSEFSFDFALLLPQDDININERARALGLWCQGFLKGLKNVKLALRRKTLKVTQDVREVLLDLKEIAKIRFGDIASNEEDETAFVELLEYVRLSAVLIYQELHPNLITVGSSLLH